MPSKFKSQAQKIPVAEAVGMVLAHDITEIRPGEFKGAAFKKGHIIREDDIPHLKRVGKENIYVLSVGEDEVHEDEAAQILARSFCGDGVVPSGPPAEGKVALISRQAGLLKVNREALLAVNLVPDICCSSRHDNSVVKKNEVVAATRAIPLLIQKDYLEQASNKAKEAGGIFRIKPLFRPRAGLVVTGQEVFSGKIKDKFAPVIKEKISRFNGEVVKTILVPDDIKKISAAIRGMLKESVNLIVVAGGMSVDPDDVSRLGIADSGAEDIVYGTPVLPGAMFLSARLEEIPLLGLPACTIFYAATVLDLLLPRVLAGERLTRLDFARLGHGGLCLNCEVCRYPVCPFGK